MTKLYVSLMVLNCILAVVPFLFARRRMATISFSLAVLAMTSWMACIFFVWRVDNPIVPVFGICGSRIFGLFFSCVYLALPRPQFSFPRWLYGVLAVPPLGVAFIAPTRFIVSSMNENTMQVTYGVGHPLFAVITLSYMALAFAIGLRGIVVFRGIDRLRLLYVIFGLMLTFSLAIFTNLILPIMGSNQYTQLGPLFTIFFIASTYFAIYKYRLMNIQFILKKGLFIFLMTSVVALAFSSSVLHYQGHEELHAQSMGLNLLMSASILVFLYPHIRQLLDEATNKVFFRARPNVQNAMRYLGDAFLKTVSVEALAESVVVAFSTRMKLDGAVLYLVDNLQSDDCKRVHYRDGVNPIVFPDYLPSESRILELCRDGDIWVTEELLFRYEGDAKKMAIYDELIQLGIHVLIPLFVGNTMVGVLGFGSKLSGEQFSLADITLFQTLQSQLSTVLNNIYSYMKLESQISELHELNKLALQFNRLNRLSDVVSAISTEFKRQFKFDLMVFYSPHMDSSNSSEAIFSDDANVMEGAKPMPMFELPISALFGVFERHHFQPIILNQVPHDEVTDF